MLTQLVLQLWASVRGSADDISNYFHLLKHHDGWIPGNAVGRPHFHVLSCASLELSRTAVTFLLCAPSLRVI